MQGVVMLKHTGPMTEISYFRDREPVGMKRRARREFWRAFRRESSLVVAEQLNDVGDVSNVFTSFAQSDAEQVAAWDTEARIEARMVVLMARKDALRDELYEVQDEAERLSDRLWCIQNRTCMCSACTGI